MGELTRRQALALAARGSVAAALAAFVATPTGKAFAALGVGEEGDHTRLTLIAFAHTVVPGAEDEGGSGLPPGADWADPWAVDVLYDPVYGFATLAPAFVADLDVSAVRHGLTRFRDGDLQTRTAIMIERLEDPAVRLLYVAVMALVYIAFYGDRYDKATGSVDAAPGVAYIGFPGRSAGYPDHSYRLDPFSGT